MPIYPYHCPTCDHSFEIKKPMVKAGMVEWCPKCGIRAERIFTPIPFSFGFRLTERSHQRFGPKDEMERDV